MGLGQGIGTGYRLRKSLLTYALSQEVEWVGSGTRNLLVMTIMSMTQLLVVTLMWSEHKMGSLLLVFLQFMDLLI